MITGIPVAFASGTITVVTMGVDLNAAVWVGFTALCGLAVDDDVVMAACIHQLLKKRKVGSTEYI
ncbi:hypothetical protein [Rubripirellula amarantea]|uniref:hypothetical protein n=1 Tax=Rubripirellula amarantea TaxID=2527999 RepID=UPI001F5E585F|nr:hypothetical protein [Rubripirellula amarantea]